MANSGRFLLLLGLAPMLLGFGPPALVESHAARAPMTEDVRAAATAFRAPAVDVRAGILIDAERGDVLWERDADRRLPMASTTKIMTALVAVERAAPSTLVRVRAGAGDFPGQSVAGLRAGDELPLGEALFALMLPSGNDAAVAIAGAIAGSSEGFVDLMNRRALELGLRDTRFTNPHGLDAPDHFTSARDLARLTRLALENPRVAEVVATREHAFRTYRWSNLNRLLTLRPDATGVKTGTTEGAGQTLVASARRGERRAIAVLLNAGDRWVAADRLLDHFFLAHQRVEVRPPDSPFYRGLVLQQPQALTVPAWQAPLAAFEVRPDATGATLDVEIVGRRVGALALVR